MHAVRWMLVASATLISTTSIGQTLPSGYGSFPYPLQLEMLPDGRTAKLISKFTYIDASNQSWEAPTGTVVDGASIPQVLWTIVGSPWTGKYREASVVHDYYCDKHSAPWKVVHRNFYSGMLANGVDTIQAKIMYAAVYRFGPRWDFDYIPKCPNCAAVARRVKVYQPKPDKQEARRLKQIAAKNPPLETIEGLADRMFSDEIGKKEIGNPIWAR
jgi:hypothetical protein